jgi:AcrR family transcriptional regulator
MRNIDTREALLDAAEQLFAERGLYGVSLGEVGRHAHQHNRSAIQYHFGSRQALIDAIAGRHVAMLNERRADMLRTLDLTGRAGDLRALVEALIVPPFRLLGSSGSYFRFIVQWSFLALPARGLTELLVHPDADPFGQILRRIDSEMSDLDPRVRELRYHSVYLAVLQSLAECEAKIDAGDPLDETLTITALVDLAVGILETPDHTSASQNRRSSASQNGDEQLTDFH